MENQDPRTLGSHLGWSPGVLAPRSGFWGLLHGPVTWTVVQILCLA